MKIKRNLFITRPQIASKLMAAGYEPTAVVPNPWEPSLSAWTFKYSPGAEQIVRECYCEIYGNGGNE